MKKYGVYRTALAGALTGAASGLLGGGGGMLAVPLLERAGLSLRRAHATAIAVVLPACMFGGAVYAALGLLPLSVLLPVTLGVVAGGRVGARLLSFVPPRVLDAAFCLLTFLAGGRMLFP